MGGANFRRGYAHKQVGSYQSLKANREGKGAIRNPKKDIQKVNAWRKQKYSLQQKLDNWKESKKKKALKKSLKQTSLKFDVQKVYEEEEKRRKDEGHVEECGKDELSSKKCKKKSFKTPHERSILIKEKKQAEKLRREEIHKEKMEMIKQSNEKRREIYKKLNKKTRKGQPVMKDRLEYLLEKIQNNKELYTTL